VEVASELDELMARYQAGDFAAATALVDRLGPRLHRLFRMQSASGADADDLLQETWLRIHRVRHTYRAGEPVLPWFYAIARRVHIDHRRRLSRISAAERRLGEISATHSPAESASETLEALLAPLPESQREVILLMKVEGMSLEEVARATACSVGAVKQKVHRAYTVLREKLSAGESPERGLP
jgi:RNA polymerase sigma-70 factor, ECF subfamily